MPMSLFLALSKKDHYYLCAPRLSRPNGLMLDGLLGQRLDRRTIHPCGFSVLMSHSLRETMLQQIWTVIHTTRLETWMLKT